MNRITTIVRQFAGRFQQEFFQEKASTYFCKAVAAYYLLKLLATWSADRFAIRVHNYPLPGSSAGRIFFSMFNPVTDHVDVFVIAGLVLCLVAIIFKPRYWIALLLLVHAIYLFRLQHLMFNGSDIVQLVLMFIAIPLSSSPRSRREGILFLQQAAHNTFWILAKVQIALMYLLSGVDKLKSEAWRSGEAVAALPNLGIMFNPGWSMIIPRSHLGLSIMAWCIISFEIVFPVLIWWRPFRIPLLLIGIAFHLAIAMMLSLPDFGLVMIVSYSAFLCDRDYEKFGRRVRPLPL